MDQETSRSLQTLGTLFFAGQVGRYGHLFEGILFQIFIFEGSPACDCENIFQKSENNSVVGSWCVGGKRGFVHNKLRLQAFFGIV